MAKGRALDRRRKSVRNIRKITRTMELIATAFAMVSDAPDTFEVFLFRSYAEYLWTFLVESAHPDAIPDVFR